ncbi:dihydrolipoyl dehydrogenase family protein [Micromonospora endolithica]|uniref:Oxidoreductase n=1 Tax=Micromonospora endolithica TaxID=230091 RepID=A0A3A9ZH38_9ACTN|nr:FAD-dependent oxidoreductase [Micromonospora endolithica]RKN47610.1 oxidoreductase [Micromonospora endolithica]TWJ21266.1 pyruvate/2-oxoglutarate dehydrogenase complex dihydrolipoamide dehydrogenase (E3) component [Micromonospora endolithica]
MADLDLLVLGGGTAGLVSAVIAGGLGARVALVERDRTGGECLWTGCVPSKALIEAADLAHRMRRADRVGLAPVEPAVDLAEVMAHIRAAQRAIEPHDAPERVRAAGAEVITDEAVFVGPRRVRMKSDGRAVTARCVLVAVGSAPELPPIPGLAEAAPLTSDTVWGLEVLPARLLVLGGGPVGCELGQAFARLGSQVTLVERGPRLLAREDPDVGELITARLRDEGVDVRTSTEVTQVRVGGRVRLTGGQPGEIDTDRILVAGGRRPRTDGLGLPEAGVALTDRGAVRVDTRMRTTAPGVYAAGDVTGELPFTHVAAHQAATATLNALFWLPRYVRYLPMPYVVFTDPEVARVGLRAAQARHRWGDRAVVARLDLADVDRAVAAGRTDGWASLVADPSGRLVGATVVAPSAGEVIGELAALVARRARLTELYRTVHPYPTYALAAVDAVGEHLQRRLLTPTTRRLVRPVLAALRTAARTS